MKTTMTTTAITCMLLHSLACLAQGAGPQAESGQEQAVTFQLNDALIKGKLLSKVGIAIARQTLPAIDGQTGADSEIVASGATDAHGRFQVRLSPGTYLVSYRKKGYVPIDGSPTEITGHGQIVTTTLTMLLEAEGRGQRRIKIILNWGSDQDNHIKDADSHLVPLGGSDDEVYFSNKKVENKAGLVAELDVDDMEWGGPETITLLEPPPGSYAYWVHDYSEGPGNLGYSKVVVRVVIDDRVAGEYRPGPQVDSRDWRPFKALVVDDMLVARVEDFSNQERVAADHLKRPAGNWAEVDGLECDSCDCTVTGAILLAMLMAWAAAAILRRNR
jgi:hypothetical protein